MNIQIRHGDEATAHKVLQTPSGSEETTRALANRELRRAAYQVAEEGRPIREQHQETAKRRQVARVLREGLSRDPKTARGTRTAHSEAVAAHSRFGS